MSRSQLSKFVEGAVSVGAGNLSIMIMGLLGVVIVARVLPPAEFGAFVLIQVVAQFLTRMSVFGMDLAIPKFMAGAADEADQQRVVNTSMIFRLASLILLGLLTIWLQPFLYRLFDAAVLHDYTVLLILFFALTSTGQLFRAVLQGFFRFTSIALVDIVASVAGFGLTILLVLHLEMGIRGLILAKLFSMGAAQVVALFALPQMPRLEFDGRRLGAMLRFGFPLQINDMLTFFFLRLDTLMLGALMGPATIAYYEIARKIPESISGLYEAFRAVYYPYVARFFNRKELRQAGEMLNHSTRLLAAAGMLGAVVVLLFGPEIVTLLFSAQYLPSVPVFIILMVGLSLTFVDYTLGYTLVAGGQSDKPVYINIVHTGVTLGCHLLLIPRFGAIGAAVATVLGFALVNPLGVYFLRRQNVAVNYVDYVKPFLLFGLVWLALIPLSPLVLWGRLLLVLFYVAGLFALAVVRREDVTIFASEARKLVSALAQRLRTGRRMQPSESSQPNLGP